jgi:hypothetical protein
MAPPAMAGPHAYRPARGKPAREQVPSAAASAVRLMYLGLAAGVLGIILGIVDISHLARLASDVQYTDTDAYNRYNVSIGLIAACAVAADALGIVTWIMCAYAVRRGRPWGATLGSVMLGLDTIFMLSVVIGVQQAPAAKVMSLLVWVIGLVAVILTWQGPARAFYRGG